MDPKTAYVVSLRDHFARYHNHKETMAFSATALYFVVQSALLASVPSTGRSEVLLLGTGALLIGLAFIVWQLRLRRWGADIVNILLSIETESGAGAAPSHEALSAADAGVGYSLPHVVVDRIRAVRQSRRLRERPGLPAVLTYMAMLMMYGVVVGTVLLS